MTDPIFPDPISQGLHDVNIERVQGFLSDHYDPRSRVLRLSPAVYDSASLSAVGVACHEAGHALQHVRQYLPLKLRSAMVPVTSFGSNMSYVFIFGGFVLSYLSGPLGYNVILLGVVCFLLAFIFSGVTLPVEWDASTRAKRLMVSSGIVSETEMTDAGKVLNAAFLTYVAAAVTALLTLLCWLHRLGLLGGKR